MITVIATSYYAKHRGFYIKVSVLFLLGAISVRQDTQFSWPLNNTGLELCRWKKSTCNPLTCGFFSINDVALHHLQLFESKIGSHRSGAAVMGPHPQNLVDTASPGSSLPRVPRVYYYGWMCVYKNKHLSLYTHTHACVHTHTHIVLDIVILRSIFF